MKCFAIIKRYPQNACRKAFNLTCSAEVILNCVWSICLGLYYCLNKFHKFGNCIFIIDCTYVQSRNSTKRSIGAPGRISWKQINVTTGHNMFPKIDWHLPMFNLYFKVIIRFVWASLVLGVTLKMK